MQKKVRGLFDEQFRLDKIGKQNDPLVKLQRHIDFELFRKPLDDHFEAGKDRSQGGRPSFDYLMMFKILILQRYYNLSDDNTEYAILDRLSFMRFLGLTISDTVPDAKTIWNFKNELAKANLVEKLFSLLDKALTKKGVTYLMEDARDRIEFQRKFANLLIENVLAKKINDVTQKSYIKSWEALFVPRAWYKEENLTKFSNGLKLDIHRINLVLNEILKYFEPSLEVRLSLENTGIDYIYSYRHNRIGKYPICEVDLDVKLFGLKVENEEENHLTVLNEARLSALAISIYLASLVITPQNNFEFKILFLDNIFIGLDMSNRLPLLKILNEFKKPIIEQFVDAENNIVDRILEIDGVKQTEAAIFFYSYQVFISTYDLFWFSVAKKWFDTKANGKWHCIELFANKKPIHQFNTPIIFTSLTDIEKANYYLSIHDYPACSNHLRKALEHRIKELLPSNKHYAENHDAKTGVTEITKLKTLNQYLDKFILYCEENGINASELSDLKNLKDWYFNPFSHDNISTPIFRREVEMAKSLVEKLYDFKISIVAEAGTSLFFTFSNDAGDTREYKIKLIENLRSIYTEGTNILPDAKTTCYEWTKNTVVENPNWGDDKLFRFYNNKRNKFLDTPDVQLPKSEFWTVLHFVDNGLQLESIIPA